MTATWPSGGGGGGGPPSGAAGGVLSGTFPNPDFAADMATQAELDAAVLGAGGGAAGAAGGVLSGSYPNPGFAVNMATQAELDAVAATIGGPGSAGGVLSGTYPNPGFAVDMATQAELEAALDEFSSSVFVADDTYGVVGDGTTDDTAALNAAFQAVAAEGGGVLLIPPGNYAIGTGAGNTKGLNINLTSRMEIWAYGAIFKPAASTTAVTFDPGVQGGGTTIRGLRINCTGSTQTGFKFRNCTTMRLEDCFVNNGAIGLLFSNDGGGHYNENHHFTNCYMNSCATGIKWEAINGGDVSMEKQTFVNVAVGGFTTGYDIGPGVNMESVEHINCMIQAAGIPAATCIRTRGDLKGWKASLICEHLNSANPNCVVMNNDIGTTSNNLADLRIYCLPQTTGSGNNATWAAAPFIKHSSLVFPTIVKDGNIHSMVGAVGNFAVRIRRDFEANDRARFSYSGFDFGPGAGTALDTHVARLSPGAFGDQTNTKLYGFGLDASSQKVTGVAAGTAATDAVNKAQLDAGGGGGGGGSGIFVNVADHGADGTGTGNDTAAINTAIAALPSSGGTLFFPSGTYYVTPSTPAFTLPAGTVLLGEGQASTTIKSVDDPTDDTYIFTIGGGRVEAHDLNFQGPDSYNATTDNIIAFRAASAAGLELYVENCSCARLTNFATMFDGISQTVELVNCDLDGSNIGANGGEAMENSTCVNAVCVGGGVIARGTRFSRWGSDTPGGSNFCHVLYCREETPVQVENCRFETHRDGRYIQVNGTVAGAGAGVAPDRWRVSDTYFGPQQVGNDACHTSPLRRAIISNCTFAHTKTGLYPKGDALLTGCVFRGGSGHAFYAINIASAIKITVRDCIFEGSQSVSIFMDTDKIDLSVDGCQFRSEASVASIWNNAARTLNTCLVSNCRFTNLSGSAAISTDTTGNFALLQASDNKIEFGNYGIRIQSGATCALLILRDNYFTTIATTAVSKAGTVTSENSLGNYGYADSTDPASFNVLNFGAVGNGTTNNTTAFQNALNAAAAAKGSVFVPSGTYIINNYITIGSDTELYGQGSSSIIKAKNGMTDGYVVRNTTTGAGNSNIYIHDICIDGNRANISGDPLVSGNPESALLIYASAGACENIVLRNLWQINSKRLGIVIHDTERLTVEGCHVFGNGRDGITLRDCQTVNVVGNTVREVNDDHIGLQNCINVACTGNNVYGQGDLARGKGICVRGGEGVTITGNNMYATSGEGIVLKTGVSSGGTTELDCSRVTVSGNVIFDTATGGTASEGSGIMVHCDDATHTVKDITIIGNYVGTTAYNGISITNPGGSLGSLEKVSVIGNTVENGQERGIIISDNCRHIQVEGNVVRQCSKEGYYSVGTSSTDLTFIGNESSANTLDGFEITGFTDGYFANNYAHDNSGTGIILTAAGNYSTSDNYAQGNGTNYNIAATTVASAATITVPRVPLVNISGTTNITSVTAGGRGQEVTLVFAGALTFTDGSNLKLAGNMTTAADATISLVCDGTNWIEKGRSAN